MVFNLRKLYCILHFYIHIIIHMIYPRFSGVSVIRLEPLSSALYAFRSAKNQTFSKDVI